MSRISDLFTRLKPTGEKALVAYITAGDPAPARTAALVAALERGGADLIELGVPFSDPVADGPMIQRASERALAAGTRLATVLDIARQIRAQSQIPLLLFSYLNPLLRYGFEKLAKDAVAAGIDGVLITDVSVEEAASYVETMRAAGLDTVFLAAPTSTPRRLELVSRYSTGFAYLVSRTGVTGERDSLASSAGELVYAMRAVTHLPLTIGFGISKPEQASEAGKLADGIVVGSAFVRIVEEHGASPDLEARLESLARSLKSPLEKA
ncbi:MAG: tryptophan synthase subunit alpha [Bryobacteraceae bacterium]